MASTVKQLLDQKNIKGILSVSPETSVFDALLKMSEANIGALLIMEGEKLAGIFSERDYARKGIIQDRKAKSTPIKDLMTANVITVNADMNTKDCMEIMSARKFRHLPVVDGEKVIGILSVGDIVTAVLNEQKSLISYLETYIHG